MLTIYDVRMGFPRSACMMSRYCEGSRLQMGQFIVFSERLRSVFQASKQISQTFVSGCPPHPKSSRPVPLKDVDSFSVIQRLQTFVELRSHQSIYYSMWRFLVWDVFRFLRNVAMILREGYIARHISPKFMNKIVAQRLESADIVPMHASFEFFYEILAHLLVT